MSGISQFEREAEALRLKCADRKKEREEQARLKEQMRLNWPVAQPTVPLPEGLRYFDNHYQYKQEERWEDIRDNEGCYAKLESAIEHSDKMNRRKIVIPKKRKPLTLVEAIAFRRGILETHMRRFTAKDTGCHEYTGGKTTQQDGFKYGAFSVEYNGRRGTFRAHRVSWALANNTDPGKNMVCHECDNPICINPHHLFLGSAYDNMKDMHDKGRAKFGGKKQ